MLPWFVRTLILDAAYTYVDPVDYTYILCSSIAVQLFEKFGQCDRF